MQTKEIRRKFLQYFKDNGHTLVPSSPVIPHDDPTLLFINAGMNQFKKTFLGQTELGYTKACSSQKCIRVGGKHNDLDNVGFTTRHLTFFEMLGNFSFGDYFKKEAISFAYKVSTDVFEIDPKDLWVSVFDEDDEAFELWKKFMPEGRIVRIGAKDNFWEMGETGPCGPCTELFIDRGSKYGNFKNPANDPNGERFFEFWNLVFMQYNRETSGNMVLLPKPSVDTGMGLERLVSIKMGKESVFQTDILASLIRKTSELTTIKYQDNPAAFNVIADHLRSLSFAIADGAEPGNVDRGYVLRKILRRAVRYGRYLGFDKPFLGKILPTLIDEMGEDYEELISSKSRIEELLTLEEENFFRTLKRGGNILQTIIERSEQNEKKQISGEDAFKLKDTYGFPLEEILLLAKDSHLDVNLESYSLLEKKAKELSKKAHVKVSQEFNENHFATLSQKIGPSEFGGYDFLTSEGTITAILVDNEEVNELKEGEKASIILSSTCLYAEMGGQTGDKGEIFHQNAQFFVTDTLSPYPGIILHQGVLKKGTLILGEPVHTKVDKGLRDAISTNHTATHLLHFALEKILGPHIRQGGSLVTPTRLRFDFSHHKALSDSEITEIEKLINEKIQERHTVKTYSQTYESVREKKEIKQFFGDKYGAHVRVVDIDGFSKELCGGTHAKNTAEIFLFRILKESSIGSGLRRIEAVTGKEALSYMYERESLLTNLSKTLDAPISQLEDRALGLQDEMQKLRTSLKEMRKVHLKQLRKELMEKKIETPNTTLIIAQVDLFKEEFSTLSNDLISSLGSSAIFLAQVEGSRCQIFLKLSKDLIEKGFHAGKLIKEISPIISGSGGGNEDSAQAGGSSPENLDKAFIKVKELFNTKK